MADEPEKGSGNISDFLKEGDEKHNRKLRERAKPKGELIVPMHCTVYSIKYVSSHNSRTPRSEIVMGSVSPSYSAGMSVRAEIGIKMNPAYDGPNDPVEVLHFNGYVNLEKGDLIRAYLEKYNIETEKGSNGPLVGGERGGKVHYVDRDLKKEETVKRIEKLDKNNPKRNDFEVVLAEYISE